MYRFVGGKRTSTFRYDIEPVQVVPDKVLRYRRMRSQLALLAADIFLLNYEGAIQWRAKASCRPRAGRGHPQCPRSLPDRGDRPRERQ